MENKINFTGISNIGAVGFSRKENIFSNAISMVLKDDLKGKDFTEFKSVVDRVASDRFEYINKDAGSNVINIEHMISDSAETLIFNGWSIPLEDKSLPLFSYIAKLTRNIVKMPEKEMIVNKDYLDFEAKKNMIYGGELVMEKPSDLEHLFDKGYVKEKAQEINDVVQSAMESYFDIG